MRKFFKIIFILFLWSYQALTQSDGWHGELSNWMTVNPGKSYETQFGIRYLPEITVNKPFSEKYSFDAVFSLNTYATSFVKSRNDIENEAKMKPYRMWLRISSSQFELRLGLQKINFGSAAILRPLMWFDRIDPRDPLQLTDGVYGVLGRYYFLNNVNIWLWGLYGNDETKGWEIIPSDNKKIEYGGRIQLPLFSGEIAITYHHREADLSGFSYADLLSTKNTFPENRFGLDGKWDVGIGLWFEGVMIHQDIDISTLKYQRLMTVGADYTLDLGNGLHVLSEYFAIETAEKVFGSGEGLSFIATSLGYPLGILDNLSTMVYYDLENHDWYRFVNWQRKYDNWSLYFIGFWNPELFQIYQTKQDANLFAGKGLQIMVVFNH